MAKGNLFLGTGSNSVGDVTLMRRNGQQVARVRVRKIANPRTQSQALQRMICAAVTRLYSPLSVCLERSFEGCNRSESYSKYLKVNLKRGKDMQFAVPRDAGLCPVPVKLSGGTMPSPIVQYDENSGSGFTVDISATAAPTTLGALSAALIAQYGLQDGDQVTVIAVVSEGGNNNFITQYFRFFLDVNSTDAIPTFGTLLITATADAVRVQEENDQLAALGIIFSRYEGGSWRRSNSYLVIAPPADTNYMGSGAVNTWLDGWMNANYIPQSDVYLNGSTLPEGAIQVTIGGVAYTFVGAGQVVLGDDTYVYFITDGGVRKFFKNINERSDQFNKYFDLKLKELNNLADGYGTATAPAGIDAADIIQLDCGAPNFSAADSYQLQEFAVRFGWTPTGAAWGFGLNG